MKKITKSALLATIFLLSFNRGLSLGPLEIGFHLGLATPEDRLGQIYNSNSLQFDSITTSLLPEGVKAGYQIGIKARLDLGSSFDFVGSLFYNKFAQSNINAVYSMTGNADTIRLTNTQTIVPIAAGLNWYVINNDFFRLYATGNLAYNYITNSVEYQISESIPVGVVLDQNPTYSRIGYGLGVGADFDIQILYFNLEFNFNNANLIGKESSEDTKNYYGLTLGVFF